LIAGVIEERLYWKEQKVMGGDSLQLYAKGSEERMTKGK